MELLLYKALNVGKNKIVQYFTKRKYFAIKSNNIQKGRKNEKHVPCTLPSALASVKEADFLLGYGYYSKQT